MIYGYVNGLCKISSTTDEARKDYPEIEEWVCEEIHDQREHLRYKQEMQRSINEFNEYMEEMCNG